MENMDLELRRLDALRRYGILDTPSDAVFDCITAAASAACGTPGSAISLVDSDRLWFLAEKGLGVSEIPRDKTFCAYATAHPKEAFEVADASKDSRFKNSSLVTDDLQLRFYAAQPLCTPDGYALGTLAVFSDQPKALTDVQRLTLEQLAKLVMSLFEDRISSPVSVIGRAVENTLPSGMVIVDPNLPDCPITYCNEGFKSLTGYSEQEIIGKNCQFLHGENTDQQQIEDIQDAIKNKISITTIVKNYKKDGTEFWNELTISPITDAAGKLSLYIALQCDVTPLMDALERLEASNVQLKKSIELNAQDKTALSIANEALRREMSRRKKIEQQSLKLQGELVHIARLSTMGEMATGLAHELNQPLLAISQCADTALVTAKENSNSNSDLIDCIVDIQVQTQRAGEIIRTLRQFITRDTSRRSHVDINELVNQAIQLTKSDARSLNIDINHSAGTIPELYVDRVQIAQVLVNLLRNSVDAISSMTPYNNNEVHHSIYVKTSLDDDDIIICVTDTGPGFHSDIEPFKPFESSKEDGLGIGLSISRSIVESHEGKLWMHNSTDTGCSMCVSIPIQ